MILQYPDRNISPKDYSQFPKDSLLITKIFRTIQGEGPFVGRPSVFIRLAGCDRGIKQGTCPFCDTRFEFDNGQVMKFDDILSEIKRMGPRSPAFPQLIVFTGGEPTLQDNLSAFITYADEASRKDWPYGLQFQIESNGDRLPRNYVSRSTYLIVSPKVNPTKGQYQKLSPAVLDEMYALKCVVTADSKSPYCSLPPYATDLAHQGRLVYVSPLTVYKKPVPAGMIPSLWDSDLVDHKATEINYKYAALLAMGHDLRLSHQSHLLYGVE